MTGRQRGNKVKTIAAKRLLRKIRFITDRNGNLFQSIPLRNGQSLITKVKGFKEFEYSFELGVPFCGDSRLAFNKTLPQPDETSPSGFKLIGREFNRIARLSGTDDPNVIETFRSKLNKNGELLTFLVPDYSDFGRVMTTDSLDCCEELSTVPDNLCLTLVEVRCERDFDYIPSRSAYFLFYYPEKIRVVSHIVHAGPPLDCPGEEWEAKAYDGHLESDIYEFFAHNDGAVSVELQTQPHRLLHAAGALLPRHETFSQATLRFFPVMVCNADARYTFSPPKIPDRGSTSHLGQLKKCLQVLHETVLRAIEGNRYASGNQLE